MGAMRAVRIAIAVLALAAAGCASGPQMRPAKDLPRASELHQCVQLPSRQAAAFPKSANYEQFEVSVLNPSGVPPIYLRPGEFQLSGRALLMSAEFAEYVASAPASTAIVVDNSAGAEGKLDRERDFVRALVSNLQPRDDVALLAYSRRAYLLQPMTSDRGGPLRMLAVMKPSGPAALYDSAADALKVASGSGCYARRSVVIISSGFDTASHITAEELIQRGREEGVAIYFIGIGFSADVPKNESQPAGLKNMTRIVSSSGGQIFLVDPHDDPGAVQSVAKEISANMRGQYVVGFLPPASDQHPAIQIDGHPEYLVGSRRVVDGKPSSAAAKPGVPDLYQQPLSQESILPED